MLEQKQIEEIKQLARDIFERGTALDGIDFVHAAVNGADDDPESHFMRIARHLYVTKGYRKASDIVEKIFAEISEILFDYEKAIRAENRNAFEARFADLKKKYESTSKRNTKARVGNESESEDD